MGNRDESKDWIFDYVLTVLHSPIWEANIMNFVDEHCVIFDTEEENKLEHWDVYVQFRERVEALLHQMLTEVDLSPEAFVKACEDSRLGRDVNKQAFEQLVALDDFVAFKTLMVRRNIELELEAIKNLQSTQRQTKPSEASDEKPARDASPKGSAKEDKSRKAATKVNERVDDALKEVEAASKRDALDHERELTAAEKAEEEELAQAVSASLLEMELMHRQEHMEQMELEKVLAISLALEEERLRLAREEAEAKAGDERAGLQQMPPVAQQKASQEQAMSKDPGAATNAEARARAKATLRGEGKAVAVDSVDRKAAEAASARKEEGKVSQRTTAESDLVAPTGTLDQEASMPLGKQQEPHLPAKQADGQSVKPLQQSTVLPKAQIEPKMELIEEQVERKKREAEDTFRRNEERLQEHRQKEEDLQRQARISKEEMERRAAYLRAQRDRIVAQKKHERDLKARKYEEDHRAQQKSLPAEAPVPLPKFHPQPGTPADRSNQDSKQESEQRNAMRIALARKMKHELLKNEETRLAHLHLQQIQTLDQKLREVEHLRRENRQKEEELSRLVQIQQEARGRALTGRDERK